MRRYILIFIFTALFSTQYQGQGTMLKDFEGPAFLQVDPAWVNEKLDSMSLDEQIGQLFMVAAYSNMGKDHEAALKKLIQEQHIGGLIFFQGGPGRQANMCNPFNPMLRYL